MNREDIIRMANKAYGIDEKVKPFHPSALLHLEIFAKLVAEHEREACAKVCDEIYFQNYPDAEEWERSEEGEAIRKRSHV
jgi:hypothetical protein